MEALLENPTTLASKPMAKPYEICFACKAPLCEIHKICEEAGCGAKGYKVSSRIEMMSKSLYKPRTQKALGYSILSSRTELSTPSPFYLVTAVEDIDEIIKHSQKKNPYQHSYLARPCPKRARHGFVESRKVDSYDSAAILAAFNESCAADPEAELLLCPLIDAKMNIVVTPSRVAVGPGHDGATSGRGAIDFPLIGAPFHELSTELLSDAGVNDDQAPYVEAVGKQYEYSSMPNITWMFTQLRAGPKMGGMEHDFIPTPIKVEAVLEASGDLLEWEKQMTLIKPGVVVVHKGGSLVSHYGVHCIINHIPIMTSRVPMVGEWLEKEPKESLRPPDPQAVMRGIAIGTKLKLLDAFNESSVVYEEGKYPLTPLQLIHLMLVVAHNAPAMANGYGVWLGIATATMLRCGMAAAHGEARHRSLETKQVHREKIYHISFEDFFSSRNRLNIAQEAFLYHPWQRGFGGAKWAACTKATMDLDQAVLELCKEPNNEAVGRIIESLNVAVDQAHNNGWWLNKFTGEDSVFTQAAQQSLLVIVKAAETAFMLAPKLNEDVSDVVEMWREQAPIAVATFEEYAKTHGKAVRVAVDSDDEGDEDNNIPEEPDEEWEPELPEVVVAKDPSDIVEGCQCSFCKAASESAVQVDDLMALLSADMKNGAPVKQKLQPSPKPSTSKLPKIAYDSSIHTISSAHVRYEWEGKDYFKVHMQFKLADVDGDVVGYCSLAKLFGLAADELSKLKLQMLKYPHEVSYSSDAMGYYPLKISESVMMEPLGKLAMVMSGIHPGFSTVDGVALKSL